MSVKKDITPQLLADAEALIVPAPLRFTDADYGITDRKVRLTNGEIYRLVEIPTEVLDLYDKPEHKEGIQLLQDLFAQSGELELVYPSKHLTVADANTYILEEDISAASQLHFDADAVGRSANFFALLNQAQTIDDYTKFLFKLRLGINFDPEQKPYMYLDT